LNTDIANRNIQVPLLTRLSTFALPRVRAVEDDQPPIDVPNSIRGLAFLSQLAVYKDLIPGYRIRELTDAEQAEKVRDEVRKLREGEKGLIKSYKQYLKMLEAEIKRE
jgi:nucleolar complex protein 3